MRILIASMRTLERISEPTVTQQSAEPKLHRTKKAAEILGLEERTLDKWRLLGKGPKFVRVGTRAIRYRHEDLVNFIESGVV